MPRVKQWAQHQAQQPAQMHMVQFGWLDYDEQITHLQVERVLQVDYVLACERLVCQQVLPELGLDVELLNRLQSPLLPELVALR